MKKLKNAEDMIGYNELVMQSQILFEKFLKNFYSIWENPEEHEPLSIGLDNGCLMVRFEGNTCLHVIKPDQWY